MNFNGAPSEGTSGYGMMVPPEAGTDGNVNPMYQQQQQPQQQQQHRQGYYHPPNTSMHMASSTGQQRHGRSDPSATYYPGDPAAMMMNSPAPPDYYPHEEGNSHPQLYGDQDPTMGAGHNQHWYDGAGAAGAAGEMGAYPPQDEQQMAMLGMRGGGGTGGMIPSFPGAAGARPHHQQDVDVVGVGMGGGGGDTDNVPGGVFYETSRFVPALRGAPVSALACHTSFVGDGGGRGNSDEGEDDAICSMLFVASHTTGDENSGSGGAGPRRRVGGGKRSDRAAILATHTVPDGTLYSSVAAHPEVGCDNLPGSGVDKTLKRIYASMSVTVPNGDLGSGGGGRSALAPSPPPRHAYHPPYGANFALQRARDESAALSGNSTLPVPPGASSRYRHEMGITSLLTMNFHADRRRGGGGGGGSEAAAVSVSPWGVRIHASGGLLLAAAELPGSTCGTFSPTYGYGAGADGAVRTHVTVGGASSPPGDGGIPEPDHGVGQVRCLDMYAGLRTVVSAELGGDSGRRRGGSAAGDASSSSDAAITAICTNDSRNSMVVGCADGRLEVLDGSSLRRSAQQQGHRGGISSVAVSEDGNLICTTGYAGRSTVNPRQAMEHGSKTDLSLRYTFPDQHVLVFDVRMLGRGGVPHAFTGLGGGPRHLTFLPPAWDPAPTLLVCSGQRNGGMQIMRPFQGDPSSQAVADDAAAMYLIPSLGRGEAVTSISMDPLSGLLSCGTSHSAVVQFCRKGYETTHTVRNVTAPDVLPPSPAFSIDPLTISDGDFANDGGGGGRNNSNPFRQYTLLSDPTVTPLGGPPTNVPRPGKGRGYWGRLARRKIVPTPRRVLSDGLRDASTRDVKDFVASVPTESLGLDEILQQQSEKEGSGSRNGASLSSSKCGQRRNPNQFIFNRKASALCYDAYADPRSRTDDMHGGGNEDGTRRDVSNAENSERTAHLDEGVELSIPPRYRKLIRPAGSFNFDYAQYNDTLLWPGWDSGHLPNAYAIPAIMLLFFVPEFRSALLKQQYSERNYFTSSRSSNSATYQHGALAAELGFLFHQIECLSAHARAHSRAQVGVMLPSNLLTTFATMPEALALALLDDAPTAIETPRRLEAFYRFLVHHLDLEIVSNHEASAGFKGSKDVDIIVSKHGLSNDQTCYSKAEQHELQHERSTSDRVIDIFQGLSFVSVNTFASGPPNISTARALTLELSYDKFLGGKKSQDSVDGKSPTTFREVLLAALCRESRIRAWCDRNRTYETVVQRRVVTSLPKILAISCACAGANDKEARSLWSATNERGGHWLPDEIEIDLAESGEVLVKERIDGPEQQCDDSLWKSSSAAASRGTRESSSCHEPDKKRYKLMSVVSYIKSGMPLRERSGGEDAEIDDNQGHHVVHVCPPEKYEMEMLSRQLEKAELCETEARSFEESIAHCSEDSPSNVPHLTITAQLAPSVATRQAHLAREKLQEFKSRCGDKGANFDNEWILFNGFVVSKTNIDDARAFHVPFKDPALVIYRAIDEEKSISDELAMNETVPGEGQATAKEGGMISDVVLDAPSLSTGCLSSLVASDIPRKGDLVAIDAEFVSVQHEKSTLAANGSKVTIMEGRNALARVSVIDCRKNNVLIDDYVLPQEPVVDYLTRFSGIREHDLDPLVCSHNLVTTRTAYLKLRLLADRGCIFVGHGLDKDFRMLGLYVPPMQIIDTVMIFRRENSRMISLRFLANYLLGRDMQQETHDSIEDAKTAYEVYKKALVLKKKGSFDKVLREIYEFGRKTDWKLGVEVTGKAT